MARRTGGKRRVRGLYYREGRGWYGNFRTYAAEGGGREALIPRNAKHPTRDQHVAMALHKARLDQLRQARKDGALAPARWPRRAGRRPAARSSSMPTTT